MAASTTRERLIEKMTELALENGFHAIGIDRLLAEVGISKQTFYNHFESKEDLVLAVVMRRDVNVFDEMMALLEKHGGADARGQLEAVFDLLDTWFNDPTFNGCLFVTAVSEFPQLHDPIHMAVSKHLKRVEQKLCYLAAEAGYANPLELAQQYMILIEGALIVRHVTGNLKIANIARAMGKRLLEERAPETV